MRKFHSAEFFDSTSPYTLLPFRFTPLEGDTYVLTNLGGEYLVVLSRKSSRPSFSIAFRLQILFT